MFVVCIQLQEIKQIEISMKKVTIAIILLISSSNLLLAQTVSSVNISLVRKEFGEIVDQTSKGAMRLVSLEKTNSLPGINDNFRTLEYKGTIEVVKECYQGMKTGCHAITKPYLNPCKYKNYNKYKFRTLNIGARYSFTGSTDIMATEKGWLLNNSNTREGNVFLAMSLGIEDCTLKGNDGASVIQCLNGQVTDPNSGSIRNSQVTSSQNNTAASDI